MLLSLQEGLVQPGYQISSHNKSIAGVSSFYIYNLERIDLSYFQAKLCQSFHNYNLERIDLSCLQTKLCC